MSTAGVCSAGRAGQSRARAAAGWSLTHDAGRQCSQCTYCSCSELVTSKCGVCMMGGRAHSASPSASSWAWACFRRRRRASTLFTQIRRLDCKFGVRQGPNSGARSLSMRGGGYGTAGCFAMMSAEARASPHSAALATAQRKLGPQPHSARSPAIAQRAPSQHERTAHALLHLCAAVVPAHTRCADGGQVRRLHGRVL